METTQKMMTTTEVAARFNELAKEEKWFEIQDELFAENVKSIEPDHSPWFRNEEGKTIVRKKGEDWVKRIQQAHYRHTTEPIVAANHFVVGRQADITVMGLGRINVNELMQTF